MLALAFLWLSAASGVSLMRAASTMRMDAQMDMGMSMEARMEARMLAQQTSRLERFGINLPTHEDFEHAKESAKGLFTWIHFVSFAFMLKSLAILSSFMGQMSPLGVVLSIKEKKSTMQYPPFTFFCVFCCGLQWCVYGTFAFVVTRNYGFLILVYANACGVIMGAYYVFQYYHNCQDLHRQKQLNSCFFFAVINGIFQALVIADVAHTRALLIVGTISAGLSVMVTAAPLAELSMILKTKDFSSLPKEFVCCQFFCSAMWFGCGLLLHDTWILVPNVFGLVLGGFQVFLLLSYGDLGRIIASPFKKIPLAEQKGKAFLPAYGTLEAPTLPSCGTGGTD